MIVENVAGVNLRADLKAVALSGRVVLVGSEGVVDGFDPWAVIARGAKVFGLNIASESPDNDAAARAEAHAALYAGLENGSLRPVIRREFPLAEAAEAHRLIEGPGSGGKVVLLPGGG